MGVGECVEAEIDDGVDRRRARVDGVKAGFESSNVEKCVRGG